MRFGAGQVAGALGMTHQALGHLARKLIARKPPGYHYRYGCGEVLWLACYRHARAAGLEPAPAELFIGSPGMHLMLEELLTLAAPDPAAAVERLRNVPILYGARYRFAEDSHGDELHGEPLLLEAQRLSQKLAEPCAAVGDAGVERLTLFVTPLAPALNVLDRVIQENGNAA